MAPPPVLARSHTTIASIEKALVVLALEAL